MLDKFDSDNEDTSSKYQSDISRIASRYSNGGGMMHITYLYLKTAILGSVFPFLDKFHTHFYEWKE